MGTPGPGAAQPSQSLPPAEAAGPAEPLGPGETAQPDEIVEPDQTAASLLAEPLAGPADGPAEEPDLCPISPQSILEAMLFVGDRDEPAAFRGRAAAELMRGVEPAEIPGLVRQLNRRYAAHGCPYVDSDEGPATA